MRQICGVPPTSNTVRQADGGKEEQKNWIRRLRNCSMKKIAIREYLILFSLLFTCQPGVQTHRSLRPDSFFDGESRLCNLEELRERNWRIFSLLHRLDRQLHLPVVAFVPAAFECFRLAVAGQRESLEIIHARDTAS